jgi:ABC-2 type transport system permease protein/lipopolysaccharide transport system permease protein
MLDSPRPSIASGPASTFWVAVYQDLFCALREWRLWTMLGWNDIRLKYRRSTIGPFWITLSMAMFILILGIVYSRIFHIGVRDYLPFLTAGYITWGFISQTTTESCGAFLEGERIIKQIRLPYAVYVLRVVYRNFIIFLHNAVVFVPVAIIFSVNPGFHGLMAIPGLVLLYLNLCWVALCLSILNSRFRDLQSIVGTFVQVMLFVTPIMWPLRTLGDATYLAEINPLYHLIDIVRTPLLGQSPDFSSWLVAIALMFPGSAVSMWLLHRASRRLVFWI